MASRSARCAQGGGTLQKGCIERYREHSRVLTKQAATLHYPCSCTKMFQLEHRVLYTLRPTPRIGAGEGKMLSEALLPFLKGSRRTYGLHSHSHLPKLLARCKTWALAWMQQPLLYQNRFSQETGGYQRNRGPYYTETPAQGTKYNTVKCKLSSPIRYEPVATRQLRSFIARPSDLGMYRNGIGDVNHLACAPHYCV